MAKEKENFATTRDFTSTYAGDAKKKYILQSLFGNETAETAQLSIETKVKKSRKIKRFTSADLVNSGTCEFTPTGTLTITEGSLEPEKTQINSDICFEDLYDLWDAEDMGEGMNNEDVPKEVVNAITVDFVDRYAQEMETMYWQADTDYTGTSKTLGLIDGYHAILDDGSPTEVTGVTITASNVVAQLNRLSTAQPKGIAKLAPSKKVIFVTYAIREAYLQALDAAGINTPQDEKNPVYHGIEVRAVGGIKDGHMVLTQRDNFYIGTDSTSDWNTLKMLDQRDTSGDETVRFILKSKVDVAIGFVTETIYYTI